MRFVGISFVLAMLVCNMVMAAGQVRLRVRTGGAAAPSGDHPRLIISTSGASPTVAELQARLGTGGAQATDFQSFIDIYCKTTANGGVLDQVLTQFSGNEDFHPGLYVYGLILVTYPVAGAGTTFSYRDCTSQAVIETAFETLYDEMTTGGYGITAGRAWAVAIAYDWGYNFLSAAQRQAGIDFMQLQTNSSGGGPLHHVLALDRTSYTGMGMAFTGDGIEDADATTRLNTRTTNITGSGGSLTARTLTAGTAGAIPNGVDYDTGTVIRRRMFGEFIYTDAYRTYANSSTEWNTGVATDLEYLPQIMSYLIAPYKPVQSSTTYYWQEKVGPESLDYRFGDNVGGCLGGSLGVLMKNIARVYASTNANMAGLATWFYNTMCRSTGKVDMVSGNGTTNRYAAWVNFLGYHTVSASSPSTLGLAQHKWFDPFGLVVIRDNWATDGTGSMVTQYASPYVWLNNGYGHAPQLAGSFTISRDGPLVIHPGSGAHQAIQYSSWGGNTIIFPKPAETRGVKTEWDKGGARDATTFSTPTGSDWTVGGGLDVGGFKTTGCSGGASGSPCGRVDITFDATTHRYAYTYVDLSRHYNGSQLADAQNTQKIDNFERQLIRFTPTTPGTTPGFTVIYDRTNTTGTDVEPRWLLYVPSHTTLTTKTMTITGHSGTTNVSRGGITGCTAAHNHTSYTGATLGTISYSSVFGLASKAYWTPLIPSSRNIIEVGGLNAMNQGWQTDSHESEDPYGCQGGSVLSESSSVSSSGTDFVPWQGVWHYELVYQTTAEISPFLNVIEDVETSASAATALTTLTGTNTTGVRIDDVEARCAIFKTSPGTLTTGDFVLATVDTFDCLLTDLTPSGTETFNGGSLPANITSITHIGTSDTDLTNYPITAQGTMWIRVVVGTAGGGAGNTISW